eukprot:CAMPEP_0181308734 /NCGR_PEP_ID=MMETSP1101-20121128/11632_1 /TAXON_ID=46948 /ORGANISM="Rhodomonas abbreviata, Strain Caron Lab Isolate" /LENGTH=435 /DNA_ID=CAMNT_0023415159 /DNA_START=3 /DNA_END=1310 /DNA_ORIENTATION=+
MAGACVLISALVVLGQSLNPSGTSPSSLLARVQTAFDEWKKNPGCHLILCGGDPVQTGQSEARTMMNCLLELGMDRKAIFLEEQSTNTLQNAFYSYTLLRKLEVSRVIVITSDFHLPRAKYMFEATFKALADANHGPCFSVEGCPAPTPAPNAGDEGINALTRRQRLEREREKIILKLESRHLPTYIPAFPVPPLPRERLEQASREVEEMLCDPIEEDTAVIVLGQSLNPDGKPPATLLARVRTAFDAWRTTPGSHVILSGGDPARTGQSEAHTMMNLLLEQGVERKAIILEEQSQNTLQNAFYCFPLLRKLATTRVILVSSEFHLPRSKYLFEATFKALTLAEATPGPCLRVEGYPSPTPPPDACDQGINALPLHQRLEQERHFISHRIERDFLPTHIPRFPVPPLPRDRLQEALKEVEMLLRGGKKGEEQSSN